MPAQDKRSGAAASAVLGATRTRSMWPSVTVTTTPAVFRGQISPYSAVGSLVAAPQAAFWMRLCATARNCRERPVARQ